MVAIVDYNVGNLASIINAFKKIGEDTILVSNPALLKNYEKIVLPGVGAFGDAMEHLRENGMDEAIIDVAKRGNFIFGICLGMQLLFQKSEEFGEHLGLGLIDGEVKYFDRAKLQNLKIPHVGWNKIFKKDNQLFNDLNDSFYNYFVHSYHVICDEKHAIGKSFYGYEFVSAINCDNIFGIQPHPEKSHDIGLKILKNFIKVK